MTESDSRRMTPNERNRSIGKRLQVSRIRVCLIVADVVQAHEYVLLSIQYIVKASEVGVQAHRFGSIETETAGVQAVSHSCIVRRILSCSSSQRRKRGRIDARVCVCLLILRKT